MKTSTINPIVACARGWIGTRFHHQGRLKKTENHKGGVDCLGLLVGVAAELDLRAADGLSLTSFDKADYPHQPDAARLRERLLQLLTPIPIGDILPGDIVLLNIDGNPQHLAIVSDFSNPSPLKGEGIRLSLIHAYAPARAVVEHGLDGWWQEKIEAAFRVAS